MNRYHILYQFAFVIICGLANALLIDENSLLLFIIPGISWSFALVFPIRNFIEEKTLAYWMFPMSIIILWLLATTLGSMIGAILILISSSFAFPFLGALGAFCSYYLFSKFVLLNFSSKEALCIILLGYLSFLLYLNINSLDKNGLRIDIIVGYWQPLVGIGLSIIFDRQMRKIKTSTNH